MRALITGITGQDGSYLAELLLERGFEVFGLVRRSSSSNPWRIAGLRDRVTLIDGDLLDAGSLYRAIAESKPNRVFNLAAQSFVGRSWREPVHTAEVTGLGALRLLEAVKSVAPSARFYQASTSEMYGQSKHNGPTGPFCPRSPYGSAKLFAHSTCVNYRESYGMHISTGILFNHESPRRGREFVTRKIAAGAAAIAQRKSSELRLGNLDARRDWGWAPDYVRAMADLVELDAPEDIVVATGQSHSVADFCRIAFEAVGLDYRDYVVQDPAFVRPADIDVLVGDPSSAERAIGWKPTVGFQRMVEVMVEHELRELTRD